MNVTICSSPRDKSPILADVLAGLSRRPKRLSSKYFYDGRGSALFERICEQPEYYLTPTELAIMREHAAAMAQALGPEVLLIEYGSGSAAKTSLLLEHLETPVGYMPIEISAAALDASVAWLMPRFPHIEILPICADFTGPVRLPLPRRRARRRVLYFPGSTLGNFDTREAVALLRRMRDEVGCGGNVLIGIDLKKSPAEIEAAYNDAAGVTAAFTLNMLDRFNREFGADFDLAAFRHRARYNPMAGRVETSIVSMCEQQVRLGEARITFAAGEVMHVEISCKYAPDEFAALARRAGLRVMNMWTDSAARFSVQLLDA